MASFLPGIRSTYISVYIQKYIFSEIKQNSLLFLALTFTLTLYPYHHSGASILVLFFRYAELRHFVPCLALTPILTLFYVPGFRQVLDKNWIFTQKNDMEIFLYLQEHHLYLNVW
jgi:hypothetical protein